MKVSGGNRRYLELLLNVANFFWLFGHAGRSGRARTCDPRFWRPVLYQLSYTPTGTCVTAVPRRFKHRQRPDCKGEAASAPSIAIISAGLRPSYAAGHDPAALPPPDPSANR